MPASDLSTQWESRSSVRRTSVGLGFVASASIAMLGCNPRESPRDAAALPSAAAPAATTRPAAVPHACVATRAGAVGEQQLASCLTQDVAALGSMHVGQAIPVVIYVDRSGSMRGFLDPAYPTRTPTDFRAVLDRLVVGLHPTAGYSFGSAVRPIAPSLATFDDRAFYTDRDTRVEAVLDTIAADTTHARTHIIVGDGRRGIPSAADGQFVRMRELAERWIGAGGAFLVGTSMAPFRTVAGDPSGCRSDIADDPRQRCPLYAFAFVAPGADDQVRVALAQSFEHVFAARQRAVPPNALTLLVPPHSGGVDVNRRWASARGGAWITRVSGATPAAAWLTLRAQTTDSATADGRTTAAFLRGQGTTVRVLARPFRAEAAGMAWQPVGSAAPIRATPGVPLAVDVITRGLTAPTGLYRIDFMPSGEPSWLGEFDAIDANDRRRTYGLGRLFEASRYWATAHAADDSAAVARLLFVIN